MKEENNMFQNKRYITKGVCENINPLLQIFMWQCIDSMPNPKDYLQVFNLSKEAGKQKIIHIHETRHPNEKFLITSDSRKFLDIIDKIEWVYTIPGTLVHMSYTPVHDFETHLKSFVDLLMLADAEKLYLLVTDDMFHSGFAESASLINNRPYEVIKW